jgi:hypothetical protein
LILEGPPPPALKKSKPLLFRCVLQGRRTMMMRLTFLTLTALLFAGTAEARDRGYRYPEYRGSQPPPGAWNRGPYGAPAMRGDLVSAVIYDLQRVPSYRMVDRHERKHFDDARHHLRRFQENWRRGKFDQGRLDRAIGDLRHLVNAHQVHPRDRQILARHMEALRYLRAQRRW